MVDPFYEKMTVQYKVRVWLERMWPTFYNLFNSLLNTVVGALVAMLKSAINAIRGKSY